MFAESGGDAREAPHLFPRERELQGWYLQQIFNLDYTIDPCTITNDRWQVVLTYGNNTTTQV